MLKRALSSRNQKDSREEGIEPQSGGLGRALSQIQRKYADMHGPPKKYSRLPKTCLHPDRIILLLQSLELSIDTPNLTTIVAGLPKPLARSQSSDWPRELCTLHSWYNVSYLNHFAQLIAKELHYRSEWLYKFPPDALHRETKDLLHFNLSPYRDTFKPKYFDDTKVELIKTPLEAFTPKVTYIGQKCVACQLNDFLRDVDAVSALALLCKSRKRHGYEWPELLAFLEPIQVGCDDHWRRRWLKESHTVRKDRQKIRLARKCGGESEQAISTSDAGEEVPDVYTPDREEFFEDSHDVQESVPGFVRPMSPFEDGVEEGDAFDSLQAQ